MPIRDLRIFHGEALSRSSGASGRGPPADAGTPGGGVSAGRVSAVQRSLPCGGTEFLAIGAVDHQVADLEKPVRVVDVRRVRFETVRRLWIARCHDVAVRRQAWRLACPVGNSSVGFLHDRRRRAEVVGFQFQFHDSVDMIGRQQAVIVAIAAVDRMPGAILDPAKTLDRTRRDAAMSWRAIRLPALRKPASRSARC